jgi:hypothetical protein
MQKKCAVILAKCQKSKNNFGIRMEHHIQKIDNRNVSVWMATWTFKIKTDTDLQNSSISTQQNLEGNFFLSDSYPGCPYCGNKKILICGSCNKPFCSSENQTEIICPWDNKSMSRVEGNATRIGAGRDR